MSATTFGGATTSIAVNIADNITAPVARYAERFHGGIGREHHVGSPLGAWLLLALCGPASTGRLREELTAALGVDVQMAAALAATLIGSRHPLVGAGAAVWTHPQTNAEALAGWVAGLPAAVERGDLPTQAQLDLWAKEHTLGLIAELPPLEARTMLVLATVLATRVSWDQPFDLAPARDLGPTSPWADRLSQVLRTPRAGAHVQFIAATERAGDVAVHAARAGASLVVTSVIAAPEVPPSDVFAAAYDLATAIACGGRVARLSLFDLPLGDRPLWKLTEQPTTTTTADGREERCTAVLPAWSARNDHNLQNAVGFPTAAAALAEILGLRRYEYTARQSVFAKYSRSGFEAAAITRTLTALCAQPPKRDGVLRVAELRFGHPYAVVAVATDDRSRALIGALQTNGPWHGVPVFSAWVAMPTDAGDTTDVGWPSRDESKGGRVGEKPTRRLADSPSAAAETESDSGAQPRRWWELWK